MAQVQVTRRAFADLERLFEFIAQTDPARARRQMLSVRGALEFLADHPLMGRDAEAGRRELVISRGRDAYVAKYRWLPSEDTVLVLTIRHAREAGLPEE